MDFYAFLPSNASPEVYPDNKTSNFKIEFSRRIDLHGRWQAALIEIHYPNTFEQVAPLSNEIIIETEHAIKRLRVEPGYYPDISTFLTGVGLALDPKNHHHNQEEPLIYTENDLFVMNPITDDRSAKVSFSPALANQLGFGIRGPFPASYQLKAVKPINLSLGITPQMFVYMDILADQIVGHTRAPLLRTVPVDIGADFGSMSVFTFDHPLYFDLNTRSFDTVQINIRDHAGRHTSFAYGTSTLLVHFKQLP
jgi:hypothetical protein